MYAGLAGGLLVFSGIWHATEWMMDGRRRDTWRLVPAGLAYLVLGVLLVLGIGGAVVQIVAAICAATGGAAAFALRDRMELRKWVTSSFIVIDVLVVLALLAVFLG